MSNNVIEDVPMTPWEKYIDCGINHPMSNYGQADMIAYHRAMELIKLKGDLIFYDWSKQSIEFAQKLTGYGKWRDICPYLIAFCLDYGLVWGTIDGRRVESKDFDDFANLYKIHVTVTPKGYFSTPDEWFRVKENFRSPEEQNAAFLSYVDKVDKQDELAAARDEDGLTLVDHDFLDALRNM